MAEAPNPPAEKQRSRRSSRDTREIVRLVVGLVGLVLLIGFVVGNSKDVEVNLVVTKATTSLIWVILISALLGVLVDRLVIVVNRRRRKGKE